MKIITILLIAVMLMCCNVKSNTQENTISGTNAVGDFYISKMHYSFRANGNYGVIVNITKDSLECEYYKQQLSK